ncbi:MAG TPA: hypothetical protein VLL54_04640 [Pyrinomonadaceae bacterium]|nr:hypothetical protein [Pyrinomonadaceae bacterium]
MKTIKHHLSFFSAVFLLLAAILGCKSTPKQADWIKARKIAGNAQGLSHIAGIVVDDKFAYATIGGTVADEKAGTSGLRKIDLETGVVTNLDNGEKTPQSDQGGLALDEQFIYWSAAGSILRIPKDGGKPTVVASEHVGIGVDLAVDHEKVYWANHGYYSANSPTRPSPVFAVPKQGGPTEQFSTEQNIAHSLVADEKFVYWVTPSSIVKQAKVGGTAQVIYQASEKEGVDELAQDGDDLYFGFRGAGGSRWALRKISKLGGEPVTVVKRYSLKPIAIADDNIYFFDEEGMSADVLCKIAKNGGEVTKLDRGYASGVVSQDKQHVYIGAGDDIYAFPK